MKAFIFFLLFIIISAFSSAQNKYYTDIADSIRIDSIIKAELNNPKNMLIGRYGHMDSISQMPSKKSEVVGYIDNMYSPYIIIERGKRETINGYTGNWYRVYSDFYGGKKTGWVFEKDILLLENDEVLDPDRYNGTWMQFIGDPCIYFLTIKEKSKDIFTAKVYYAFYNDTVINIDLYCNTFPVPLKNVNVSENVFISDSSDFSKGWFMRTMNAAGNKFDRVLIMKNVISDKSNTSQGMTYDNIFRILYRVNSSTDILDYQYLIIKENNVQLYSGPSINDTFIKQLDKNEPCRIIETGPSENIYGKEDRWYKIISSGQVGWIFGAYAKFAP
jgi:hypothetical protein